MTSDKRTGKPTYFDRHPECGTLSPIADRLAGSTQPEPESQPNYRLVGGSWTDKQSSIVRPHVFKRKANEFRTFTKGHLIDTDIFRLDESSYDRLLVRLNYPRADTQAYDFRLYGPPKIANSPSTSNIENNEVNGIITEEETRSQNGQKVVEESDDRSKKFAIISEGPKINEV